jgi:thiol-disulfide isomerase/thioredoxin
MPPDGEALLKQASGEGFSRFESLQIRRRATSETPVAGTSKPMLSTSEERFVFVRPDKTRSEVRDGGTTTITISDGSTSVIYASVKNEYAKIPGAAISPQLQSSAASTSGAGASGPTTTKTLRDAVIRIKGRPYDCWVVESHITGDTVSLSELGVPDTTVSGTTTTWIDKKLLLEIQSISVMVTQQAGQPPVTVKLKSIIEDINIDQPIPDSTFNFTPPQGASEVKADALFSAMSHGAQPPDLIGKDAPPFKIAALDGKSYDSTDLKGRPIVLEFWATWCVPCQSTIPLLEHFYQRSKDDGVLVLGVDAGEDPGLVKKLYRKKTYSLSDRTYWRFWNSRAVPSSRLSNPGNYRPGWEDQGV